MPTQDAKARKHAPTPSHFALFYASPSPVRALNLAISDAIHSKQSPEFYSNLVAARGALETLPALTAENERLSKALHHIRITSSFADGNAGMNLDRLQGIRQDADAALAGPQANATTDADGDRLALLEQLLRQASIVVSRSVRSGTCPSGLENQINAALNP